MLPSSFVTKQRIEKGWSGDKKYCVTDAQGNRFLLRVSPVEQYARKKSIFARMGQVADLGVPMGKPLAFGIAEDGVYSLQTWIDGVDLEETIHTLPREKQYSYGFAAGKILKEIHKIPAPNGTEAWEAYFNRKLDRNIEMYKACPVQYEKGQVFIEYINGHRGFLAGRPQTYQHGDYHIGNMRIGTDQQLYILDFDRNHFGDPWEDFNPILRCAPAAPLFATGMVNGFSDDSAPGLFWERLVLYISSNRVSSLPWAVPFGQSQIQVMRKQAEDVLRWYDGMTNSVPTWYQEAYR